MRTLKCQNWIRQHHTQASLFLSQYTFQSKKKFTHIKSKTLIKLKISLANVKISIHNECFKTFSGNIAWLDLYALSSWNVEKQISINTVTS